jgi:predicted methyltransferase
MKHLLVLVLFSFSFMLNAQNFSLKESGKKKALKKSKAEAAMYVKKGFQTKDGSDMEQNLLDFYNEVYMTDQKNVPKYVWGMGLAKAETEQEAYEKAYKDAIEEVPGLMITYFQMWTMTSGANQDEQSKIQKAIEDASKAIASVCEGLKYDVVVYLINPKDSQIQVHLRTLTPQKNVKDMVRNEIKKELKKSTDWSDEKMTNLLTFEK